MADDNILRVGAEFDVGPLIAGTQAAGAAFDSLKTKYSEIAASAQASGDKALMFAAQDMAAGASAEQTAEALTVLGFSEQEAARATAEAASAAGVETVELEEEAAAAATAATANTGLERAVAGATGRLLGMEAGLGMAGGALGRIAAFLPGMGTLFEIALPIALISLAVDKISEFRDEVEKATIKMQDFAIDSYKQADSIEATNLKLKDQIAELEGAPKETGLKTALLEAKIEAENLSKSLEKDLQSSIELLNVGSLSQFFTSASGPEEEFKGKLQEIIGKIQSARMILAEAPPGSQVAKDAIQAQIAAYQTLNHQLDLDILALQGMEGASHGMDASIEKLREMQIGATEAQVSLKKMAEGADLKAQIPGLEAAKNATKELEKAAKEASEGEKKLQEDLSKAKIPEGATGLTEQPSGLPNEALFADAQKKMAEEAMAGYKAIQEAASENGTNLDEILAKDLSQRVSEWDKANKKMVESQKQAAAEMQQLSKKVGQELTHDFENAFDGVIRGTERLRFAFIKLGGDLILTVIHATEQMLLKWAAHFVLVDVLERSSLGQRLITLAGGEAAKKAVQTTSNIASVTGEAGVSFAAGYASAMLALPFPVNVATAPGVAAEAASATLAGGLAGASAEQGAILPRNMPVDLHKDEMVLPAHISKSVQSMAAAGTGPGAGGTNISIHALDAASLRDMLGRNQRQFVGAIRGAIRNRSF